ncbi:putative receptor-like protein kinase [Rosa sericea]
MVLSCLFLCLIGNIDRGTKRDNSNVFQVSYNTLLKATDRFSSENLIGVGTYGSVYKVFLDRAQVLVAVKVFNLLHQGSLKSFIAECEVLRSIRHRNIVKIITSCSSIDFRGNDFKALVYEFMENGTLEEWLHPTVGTQKVRSAPKNLSFVQRLDIAIDVACALDYLHNHCDTPIVHCDLKPSNILLDNDLTGRVSDFGLARFLSKPNNISTNLPSVIKLRGPVSYVAPEYETGSEASTYGDVYSFGILLLEMFTGKKPTDDMFSDRLNLHKFVSMSYFEGVFPEIADPRLLLQGRNSPPSKCSVKFKSEIGQCLRSIFEIGIVCSSESPRDRMDIHNVVSELNSVRDDFRNRLHSYSPTVGVRSRSCSSCMVCRRRMKEPPAWRSWSNRGYRQFCETRLLWYPSEWWNMRSLEVWLHPSTRTTEARDAPKISSLIQRLEIAIDVACALDFLHNHRVMRVHGDLKPSNVFLDETLMAVIGRVRDCVPARSPSNLSNNVSKNKSSSTIGSVGYTAPEYGTGNGERKYWDVYSFGILLLEIFTGKRPTDLMNIRNFVKMAIPERVTEIADSRLLQRGTNDTQKNECLISIFEIGIACSDGAQSNRMSIDRVVPRLHSIRDRLLP